MEKDTVITVLESMKDSLDSGMLLLRGMEKQGNYCNKLWRVYSDTITKAIEMLKGEETNV